jgi:Cdc6-like AAA superfamily ATPase
MVQTLKKTSSGITTDQDDEDELVSVPPPIFVTGPNSTGKTSIVRRTVQALTNDFSSQIPNAYINCATMCMSKPINALTEEIFHQLVLSRRDKEEISKSQFLTQRLSLEAPLEKGAFGCLRNFL